MQKIKDIKDEGTLLIRVPGIEIKVQFLRMGAMKLELPSRKNFHGLLLDPEPNWTFNHLLEELNSLEVMLENSSSAAQMNLMKTKSQSKSTKHVEGSDNRTGSFVMSLSDDMDDSENSEGDVDAMEGRRFYCSDLEWSDSESSEDQIDFECSQTHLMNRARMEESLLLELECEHELKVKEELRNKISAIKTNFWSEDEKSALAVIEIEKYADVRREMDKRLDKQYQRKVAEALDNHLSVVQRNHEQRSQIEERRIENEAEEMRREKSLQEEKMRQEKEAKARQEAARIAEAMKIAETAKIAEEQKRNLEDKKRAEKEAVEKQKQNQALEINVQSTGIFILSDVVRVGIHELSYTVEAKCMDEDLVILSSLKVKASETAIKAEADRLDMHKVISEKCEQWKLNFSKEYRLCLKQFGKVLRAKWSLDSARSNAIELLRILNDQKYDKSILALLYAELVVCKCRNRDILISDADAFASAYVIVQVSSKIPVLMDLILAEFNKACIFTVPKHIDYAEGVFKTRKAYFKAIGFEEENGVIESAETFLRRVESCMTLYGALVQTDMKNNIHGLKEGWAWLAKFLNTTHADLSSAVALKAFLKMAGFALFQKYRSQFLKLMTVISHDFLPALVSQGNDPVVSILSIKSNLYEKSLIADGIRCYIDHHEFTKEPEHRRPQANLISREFRA
ncbi:hypothetical protein QJS04_geneDACA004256 [Acorus gramineus]|uniref:mRNA export factor GLE1 n=1 Tax=Acorus gramineus TaxID=55184 RepID=A0AAV9B2Q1_ACOGR|nr:hypothetical protein QJS04_geneDACA004256 [Acorus gramineus]